MGWVLWPTSRHGRHRAHALVAACLALAVGVSVAAVDASTPPGVSNPRRIQATFSGIVTETAFAADPSVQRRILDQQRKSGVRLIRQTFDWARLEPVPGFFDFSVTDGFMLEAARAGIEVMPILFGAPDWGTSRPPGVTTRGTYPPKDRFVFAAYAQAVAQRYGRGGTLWAQHPEVPARPIINYQVWNEPNLSIYWLPKISPLGYTRLLKQTAVAIRGVDRKARIVLAGMPTDSHLGAKLPTYLDRLYTAHARGTFDVVAINAYAPSSKKMIGMLRDVRKVMDKRRDPNAGMWVTEFGWGVGGPAGITRTSVSKQASLVSGAIKALGKARRELRLQGFVYYGWQDLPPYQGRTDFWGLHTGLYYLNGRPKPAAHAYARAVRSLR